MHADIGLISLLHIQLVLSLIVYLLLAIDLQHLVLLDLPHVLLSPAGLVLQPDLLFLKALGVEFGQVGLFLLLCSGLLVFLFFLV